MYLKSIHLFICLCFTLTANSTLTLYAAEKPNILFIFADDWGWGDLSCHGHPYVKTPHIDRLASEGHRLSSFYGCERSVFTQSNGCYDRAFPGSIQYRCSLRMGATEPKTEYARLAGPQRDHLAGLTSTGRVRPLTSASGIWPMT